VIPNNNIYLYMAINKNLLNDYERIMAIVEYQSTLKREPDKYKGILEPDKKKLKHTKEKYYETTPSDILFRGDSLFTDRFLQELSAILRENPNSGKEFKRKSASEKKEISEKLDSLLEIESHWKDLVRSSKYDMSKIESIFPKELDQFIKIFNKGFYPPEGSTNRRKSIYSSELCKHFFLALFKYIKNNEMLLNEQGLSYELTEKDLDSLVSEVEPSFLFKELVKISMKKAYDTNINIQSNNPNEFMTKQLDSNFLQAKRAALQYAVTSYIRIYLANILLNFLSTKSKPYLKEISTPHIIRSLKYLQSLFKEELHFSDNPTNIKWYYDIPSKITMILLSFYQNTDVVKATLKEKSSKRTRKNVKNTSIIYVFDHKLDNSIAFSHNLPRITPPLKADSQKCIIEWLSPVKGGHHNIQVSDEAFRALNMAQKKEFVVNTRFEELLRDVDSKRDHVQEFTTRKEFDDKKSEFLSWSESVWGNTLNISMHRLTRSVIGLKKSKIKNVHSKVADLCGITHLECYANAKKNELRNELTEMKASRQLLLTSLDISSIYQDYPLYYGTRLDFRLRMYPLQYLMSRTSGYLKNLLQESVPRTVTTVGMSNMLDAYYSPFPDLYRKFNTTNLNKKTFSYMKKFFEVNKIDLSNIPLYFELLESEIHNILLGTGKKKTALQLEIDQVGSGPTLIALVTGNKALAEKCNLLGGDFSCIYTFLLEKSHSFISEKLEDIEIDKESNAYRLLTEERKAQKYALMCFFYNEQHISRTKRWVSQYEEKYGTSVQDEEYKLLSKFSVKYSEFMEYVFPKLTKQLDLLNDALSIVVDQGLPVKIKTLDNCLISWDFDHVQEVKKNYFNPVSGRHDQFRLKMKIRANKVSQKSRKSKHKQSFRPNFIHSLDATIMRMFLYRFYEQTGKKLNHLHDCVMLHPNDVSIFYSIVTDIYCSSFMKTLAQDLVFSSMKSDTRGQVLDKLVEIEKEFISNMDKFELTTSTFNPRKCYRYEGAK
jgi:hypothetical protein